MILPERPRRLRQSPAIRRMVRETRLSADQFISPLFVREEEKARHPIASMPGQYQLGFYELEEEVRKIQDLGIPAVLLFGIPSKKDAEGSSAWDPEGVICKSIERIKKCCPDLCVITDVCLCEYTSHGHCGIIADTRRGTRDVDNDATVEVLIREALAHARAGADMVAPSDMMDGRIGAIRDALDAEAFEEVAIMAYSAKYASSFYGPFRDAAESPPSFGDRRSYQMDPANANEALREITLDLEEGADIVMVKPALAYLDIIRQTADTFSVPIAAYNVSGEYAMIKAAAAQGWLDEKQTVLEILTAIHRAGASLIISYFAQDAAKWLQR
ncbi:MAG: porphobilinogen synthase [Candidatus Hydrogenedens sp.]|nr:porphobilinogen synthase [Candidatus Hydrogenedens sp.]